MDSSDSARLDWLARMIGASTGEDREAAARADEVGERFNALYVAAVKGGAPVEAAMRQAIDGSMVTS